MQLILNQLSLAILYRYFCHEWSIEIESNRFFETFLLMYKWRDFIALVLQAFTSMGITLL
jgi:hypothetical protein